MLEASLCITCGNWAKIARHIRKMAALDSVSLVASHHPCLSENAFSAPPPVTVSAKTGPAGAILREIGGT